MINLKEKVLQGFFWSTIQNWGSHAVSLVIVFVLIRLLEPKVFGLFALALIFIYFMRIFLREGFSQAIIQFENLDSRHLNTAFWINLLMGVLFIIVGLLIASFIARWFHQPILMPVIRWLSLGFFFDALISTPEAIFRRNFQFKILAVSSLWATLLGGGVGIVMAFGGFGIWSLVARQLIGGLITMAVLWRNSQWHPNFQISTRHLKELVNFTSSILGSHVINFLGRRLDFLLIGYFLGPVALGYYAVSHRLLMRITRLLRSIVQKVMLPMFSRLQSRRKELQHMFYQLTKLVNIIAFPMFCSICVLAPQLVIALFGEKWLSVIPLLQILAFGFLLTATHFFHGILITAMGKPSWNLWRSSIATFIRVIAFCLAVRWGMVAVAIAATLVIYLVTPIRLWMVHKLISLNLSKYLRTYIVPLVGTIVMIFAIFITQYFLSDLLNLYMLLGLSILVGVIVYSSVLLLISPKLIHQLFKVAKLAVVSGMREKV